MQTFIIRTYVPGHPRFAPMPHVIRAESRQAANATAIWRHRQNKSVPVNFTIMVAFRDVAPSPQQDEPWDAYELRCLHLAATANEPVPA